VVRVYAVLPGVNWTHRKHLEAGNEVRNLPRSGGADGNHVGSNERNDDGRLHQMPCRQQRAHRLPDLPFVARERKLISLAQAFYPEHREGQSV